MDILIDDIYSTVLDPKNHMAALAAIRCACRAKPSGYKFMPRYKKGMWDGYISLMHGLSKFPTGLLPLVMETLDNKGFHPNYISHIAYPNVHITSKSLNGIVLRDYQVQAINNMLSAHRGIAKMATNSGKTEVMAGIIKALNFPHTIVLQRRKELLYQTAERFEMRLGRKIGVVGDGVYQPSIITVAMVQTLASGNRVSDAYVEDNEVLMIDECHTTSSDQTLDVVFNIPGLYRFGFSGTPLKYDELSDMKLIAATGEVIIDVPNEYLIDNGYSAVPQVYIIDDPSDEYDDSTDYPQIYADCIVRNEKRNNRIKELALGARGVVLIMVNQVGHGDILQRMIPDSTFVHGSDTTEYRKFVLETMKEGTSGVFISSPIFDEGIDVPSIDCLILAGGGRSHVKLLQRIGRGMRRKSGDNVLEIYDFCDHAKYLTDHSRIRKGIYEQEGFSIKSIR